MPYSVLQSDEKVNGVVYSTKNNKNESTFIQFIEIFSTYIG